MDLSNFTLGCIHIKRVVSIVYQLKFAVYIKSKKNITDTIMMANHQGCHQDQNRHHLKDQPTEVAVVGVLVADLIA